MKPAPDATSWLPVEALTPDGLLVRSDGTLVRFVDVVPGNPLALDDAGCERMTRGFTDLLARVPAGHSVQCYAQATPVPLDDILAAARAETDAATAALVDSDDPNLQARGTALRRLAALHEDGLREHATNEAALDVRYLLVVPWQPDKPTLQRTLTTHERLARESLLHTERLRSALTGLDVKATLLNGADVADVLWRRFSPAATGPPPSHHVDRLLTDLTEPVDAETARRAARRLRAAICRGSIDSRARTHLRIDGGAEQTIHLAGTPERTFYGWLLHAMQSALPWTLSVHVHVRDRATERVRLNRRARRLWGVNEGSLDRRARPDRQQHAQEAELEEIIDELATGAQTLTDVSIYQTLREPTGDTELLNEHVTSAIRDLGAVVDAPVSDGDARQPDLWTSSLPLALDAAKNTFPLISRNAADSVPFLSTSCGSPGGIPFAFADPGRTLERLHPFDRVHDNGTTLLFAKSGGGKTMTTIALTSAALPRGCQVNVIDRSAGHWKFLTLLIPGAAHLELGGETGATINPWDVDDPAAVPRSKVAFLVRLHALLVGDHDTAEDSYGLGPLERNLLAVAIRRTYDRAASERTTPRQSLLRDTLHQLARDEATSTDGSAENAAVYRNLAHRLGEFCADGTYGYLFDRPTTIAADDAPLVVFNTRQVPEDVAAPALFAVLECISRRVERRHEAHLRHLAEGRTAAGPLDGTSAVVLEEAWKLVQRRVTGAWVNELVRRARHIGLWFIAITQQRQDLACPEGQTLLDNATIQIFQRNGPQDLAHLVEAQRLSQEEVDQITRLVTEKRSHAQAYVVNGERGRGTVTIRLGAHIYWLATSDPVLDVPARELALEKANLAEARDDLARSSAAFSALEVLAGASSAG